MRKLISCLLVGGMFIGLLAGCSSEKASKNNEKVISILMEDVADTEIVKDQLKDFEAETGIAVKVETIGYSSMHEKLLTQMINNKNAYDVVVVDCYWVGEFTSAGWLEDLDPYIQKSKFDTSQYLDSMMEMVGEVDGTTYMLPFYNYMMALVYRTDVLEDPTLQNNYQSEFKKRLAIPENFEEYIAMCKWITTQEATINGVVMQGARPDPIVVEWCNYLYSCGGDFYDENGNVIINSPEAKKAVDLYIDNIKNAAPAGSTGFGFDEAFNVFAQGDAFSYITYNWMIPKLNNSDESAVSGKVALAPIPGGNSLNAGWGWGIPKNAVNKESGWEFIQWIESNKITKKRALAGGSPTRTDVMNDNEVLEAYPYLETVCNIMETSKMIPIMDDATQLVEIIGRELSLAVAGDKTSQEAVDTIAKEMETMK